MIGVRCAGASAGAGTSASTSWGLSNTLGKFPGTFCERTLGPLGKPGRGTGTRAVELLGLVLVVVLALVPALEY